MLEQLLLHTHKQHTQELNKHTHKTKKNKKKQKTKHKHKQEKHYNLHSTTIAFITVNSKKKIKE